MNQLKLEINSKEFTNKDAGIISPKVMMTPDINKDFWKYRVKLFKDQAILGFPKFSTIGIGFAQEDYSWNTNLPYSKEAEKIYEHIIGNKKYDNITGEQCIEAIKLIQEAIRNG